MLKYNYCIEYEISDIPLDIYSCERIVTSLQKVICASNYNDFLSGSDFDGLNAFHSDLITYRFEPHNNPDPTANRAYWKSTVTVNIHYAINILKQNFLNTDLVSCSH